MAGAAENGACALTRGYPERSKCSDGYEVAPGCVAARLRPELGDLAVGYIVQIQMANYLAAKVLLELVGCVASDIRPCQKLKNGNGVQ